MKKIFSGVFFVMIVLNVFSQRDVLYDPSADAQKDIDSVVKKAKQENKFVLIEAGGDWCIWCTRFAHFCKAHKDIDSTITASFITYHLNYSSENKNKKVFEKYDYPQRFGFPVFIILNGNGERIHTQNSEYLEDGRISYNRRRVKDFLLMWSPQALDPAQYK